MRLREEPDLQVGCSLATPRRQAKGADGGYNPGARMDLHQTREYRESRIADGELNHSPSNSNPARIPKFSEARIWVDQGLIAAIGLFGGFLRRGANYDIVRYFFRNMLTNVRTRDFLGPGKYMAGDGDMFDATQVGIETSKAASPIFHRAMERFIESVTGTQFRIVNPFQFLTKGQALRAAGIGKYVEGLGETFSCDRFPDWREGRPQCGTCASCILRRLSLEVCGLSHLEHGTFYARDVKSNTFIPGDSAASVLSHYEEQAMRIEKALGDPNSGAPLARDFPELYEAEHALLLSGSDEKRVRESLFRLLRVHVAEWKTFTGRAALHRYLEAA